MLFITVLGAIFLVHSNCLGVPLWIGHQSQSPASNLKLLIVRSFFVYLLKSILTKYLLDEEKIEGIFTKRNIITIIISVITFSLFLLFDETNILI